MKYTAVVFALIASVEGSQSPCVLSGASGVTCKPSDLSLFATGMEDSIDENIGEDLI